MIPIEITIEIPRESVRALAKAFLEEMMYGIVEESKPQCTRVESLKKEMCEIAEADLEQALARTAGQLMLRGESVSVIRAKVFKEFGITSVDQCPKERRAALLKALEELV